MKRWALGLAAVALLTAWAAWLMGCVYCVVTAEREAERQL